MKRLPEVITSRSNPLVVKMAKLENKKQREEEGLFRLDGVKLLCEALAFSAEIEYVFMRESSSAELLDHIEEHFGGKVPESEGTLVMLGDSAFEKMSNEKSPEGVITVAKYIDKSHKIVKIEKNTEVGRGKKALMLESVRDPGNLGTIMRTAAAFGTELIILSADCADIYNPKTVRAAMGAVFKVETLRVNSVSEAICALRADGRRVFATALDADALKLGDFKLRETDVFLIGNEGHGLSAEAIAACERSVFIPMSEGTESLNASVAASVCMWEMSKI